MVDARRDQSTAPGEPVVISAPELPDTVLQSIATMIERSAGIRLTLDKRELVRLRLLPRLRARRLRTFAGYAALASGDRDEQRAMVEALCIHETRFFREQPQLDALVEEVFPRWTRQAVAGRRQRRIRAWSAGCATGEEPFTLALLLAEHFPRAAGWRVEVVASDVSSWAMERTRRAVWPSAQESEIPENLLRAYMLRGRGAAHGTFCAGPELRDIVVARQLNLNDRAYPGIGRFDLIACRNVLIYYGPDTRTRVVRQLLDCLDPDGALLVGHSESLRQVPQVRPLRPTIYVFSEHA